MIITQSYSQSLSGCTDVIACNYNAEAIEDDGSCEFIEQVTISGETETCEESILLEAIGGPYDSYQWYLDGEVINNENQATLLAQQSGAYKIEAQIGADQNNFSLFFDGENDYVEINDENIWALTLNDFTISAAININNIPDTPSSHVGIIQQYQSNNDKWQIYWLDNQLYFGIKSDGAWNEVSVPWEPQTNTWYHISCVRESGEITFYVNGNNIGSELANIYIPNLEGNITLGKYEWDTNWTGLNGNLDNIQLWNTALSQEEINNYISCPPLGTESGIINLWGLEESGQAVIFDFVNNFPGGQLINMQTNGAWSINTPDYNCQTCLTNEETVVTINTCGCTNINANNYNPVANLDDGSCIILGCTDPSSENFNATANTDNGSCEYNSCEQTTNNLNISTAYNESTGTQIPYTTPSNNDPQWVWVNNPNGPSSTAVYISSQAYDCGAEDPTTFLADSNPDNNNEEACEYSGWITPSSTIVASNTFTQTTLGPDGYVIDYNNSSPPYVFSKKFCLLEADGISLSCALSADNYAELYLNGDLIGSTNISATGLLPNANYYNVSYINYETTLSAGNHTLEIHLYNNGSFLGAKLEGFISTQSNENQLCTQCSNEDVFGCTNLGACNYDDLATIDNGSCFFPETEQCDGVDNDCDGEIDEGVVLNSCETCEAGLIINNDLDNNGICDTDEIEGCTSLDACNYDDLATIDNGSCFFPETEQCDGLDNDCDGEVDEGVVLNSCETCEAGLIINNDLNNNGICDTDEIEGCTNPGACNYDFTANIDDGSCQLCASREFNDGSYLDVDSEIINAQGITISFWVNDNDFCANPEDFATYIDFGSQDSYRYVIRNRSCKIEAFFEGDMLPTEFDWGTMDWGYPKASAAGGIGPQSGWRQITAVFCPTTIRLYVDGNIVASNGTGVYFSQGFNLFAEDVKRIGSNQVDYEPANAMIDEVRIWNRALSGEEVLARAGGATTLNMDEELNLNGYWQMDCENPFLNEVTEQLGVDNLSVVNENFNNNSCETDNNYDYTCPVDLTGVADCNSCDPPEGCTDEEACNYDYLAIVSIPDACFYIADYCPELEYPEYMVYDCDCKCINDSDSDDVCDELEVDGCSEDETACNYNPEGTEPCVYAIDQFPSGLYDCDGICYNDNDPPLNNPNGLGDGICDEIDNCPDVYNPDQFDFNDDGIGDACDGVGLEEGGVAKELIKVTDILGREIQKETKGSTLMYWYNTGEVEIIYNFK